MHTPEQNRKKAEAMAESKMHAGRNVTGQACGDKQCAAEKMGNEDELMENTP